MELYYKVTFDGTDDYVEASGLFEAIARWHAWHKAHTDDYDAETFVPESVMSLGDARVVGCPVTGDYREEMFRFKNDDEVMYVQALGIRSAIDRWASYQDEWVTPDSIEYLACDGVVILAEAVATEARPEEDGG